METNTLILVIGLGILGAAIMFGVGYWFGYTGAQMRVLDAEKRMVRRGSSVRVNRQPERRTSEELVDFTLVDAGNDA